MTDLVAKVYGLAVYMQKAAGCGSCTQPQGAIKRMTILILDMKHIKLNNGHQLAILNLIDLEVFRGIHAYFMNVTGMLVTLSQTSQFFIVIV